MLKAASIGDRVQTNKVYAGWDEFPERRDGHGKLVTILADDQPLKCIVLHDDGTSGRYSTDEVILVFQGEPCKKASRHEWESIVVGGKFVMPLVWGQIRRIQCKHCKKERELRDGVWEE